MRTAFETLAILAVMTLLLAPLFSMAKDEKDKEGKPGRRIERDGNRLVEKIQDKGRSKGTNVVWKTGRTFPMMFSRPETNKQGKKK